VKPSAAIATRVLLWAALGLGAGLLAAIALPLVIGQRPLTVLSGSMEPALATGDVVVVDRIEPRDAAPGDVVTYRDPGGRLVTHRVRAVRPDGAGYEFITRGDANNAGERWTLRPDGELSRAVFRVPHAGRLLAVTSSPAGRLVLVVIPLLLLGAIEVRRIWRPVEAPA
jgi:signal peptidase